MKTIDEMNQKDFRALKQRKWNEDIGVFDTLVILPERYYHDSGYRCMNFVAVRGNKPVALLSGCSDVLHINGIGGLGKWAGTVPTSLPARAWNIDCLRKSGLLRLFCWDYKMKCGAALSSFDIFAVKE